MTSFDVRRSYCGGIGLIILKSTAIQAINEQLAGIVWSVRNFASFINSGGVNVHVTWVDQTLPQKLNFQLILSSSVFRSGLAHGGLNGTQLKVECITYPGETKKETIFWDERYEVYRAIFLLPSDAEYRLRLE